MRRLINIYVFLPILVSCGQKTSAPSFAYPDQFDTKDKEIFLQEKKTYDSDSIVIADNQFAGARLNNFKRVNDSTFEVTILPENTPINPSPWYAFKLYSEKRVEVYLSFEYGGFKHRYYPKTSQDGLKWTNVDSTSVGVNEEGIFEYLKVTLPAGDTLWVAGQDVLASPQVRSWANKLAQEPFISVRSVGKSKLGRDIPCLDINQKPERNLPILVVLSRQHPPEVTGYKAMQYFIDELISKEALSTRFLAECRVLVFPLMNPDGVDLGHWRHSAGGVDLNRDWAEYNQPEVRQVVDYIFQQSRKSKVYMGIDFHSTWYDVFYTNDTLSDNQYMKTDWFDYMENQIADYKVNERSSALERPVSKSWFFSTFQVEGVTYEVGDSTPEEIIELKGRTSAQGVMNAYFKER